MNQDILNTTEERNNNDDDDDDSNSNPDFLFTKRKIVRIKRTIIKSHHQGRINNRFIITMKNKEFISKSNSENMTNKIEATAIAIGFNKGDNELEQQLVRSVFIQKKRKAVVAEEDEDEDDGQQQQFFHYYQQRKRIRFDDSDHAIMVGCTAFQHQLDYDRIISWL